MMAAILSALVVTLAAVGYGDALLTLLRLNDLRGLQRIGLSWGLGFGVLTVGLFWSGMIGILVLPTLAGLLLPGLILVARRSLRRDPAAHATPAPAASSQVLVKRAVIVLFAACASANLLGALAPPNFIDALVYHLYLPEQYLIHRAIVELRGIWQQYQPTAVELLYMLPLAIGSAKGAALLCMVTGLFAAAATYLLAARLAGPLAGLFAAAIFYNNPMVAWESTSCFLELAIAALGTLGCLALLTWNDTGRRAWLMVGALLFGVAASCKLNGASLVVTGVILTFGLSLARGDGVRRALTRMLGVGALAAVPVLPWLVRTAWLTGNPLYPFATSIFGDNPERAAIEWVFAHYGVGYSLSDRLLAPWHLFTQGGLFENGNYLSPLPTLLAPVVLVRAWKSRGDRPWLLLAALLLFAIWALGGHVARYVVPIQPVLCVLAADALFWLGQASGRRRFMAITVGAAVLLFGTTTTLIYDKQFLPVALGRESEDQYLQRTTWYYHAFREVCAALTPGGRVLTNAQKPTFYLDCPQGRLIDSDFDDPARLRRLVVEERFTDILIMNNKSLEMKLEAALGADLKQIWSRNVDVMVSRTFGRTATHTLALYHFEGAR